MRSPEARTKLRTPQTAQRALNALSGSRFFAGVAERGLIFDLKQVRNYLDDKLREEVQARVAVGVSPRDEGPGSATRSAPSSPMRRSVLTRGDPSRH